jgi:hypothetical protein
MRPPLLSDRGVQAALIICAVAAAGFAGLGMAWHGASATLDVYTQMPFIVSGGFGGVALAGTFLGLLAVHTERRAAAVERLWLEDAIASATEISESLPAALQAKRTKLESARRGSQRR